MLKRLYIVAFAMLTLAACANGYEQFYTAAPVNPLARYLPPGPPHFMVSSGNANTDAATLWEQGFGFVGYSRFNGPLQSQAAAAEQAKRVGAEIIVISQRYSNTVSGAIPITTPTSQTSYSNGSVNVFGSGGTATGTYSGTTTSYGSQTSYIPYAIQRYDQQALYFSPVDKRGIGVLVSPISADQAATIGTNKGMIIRAVRKGSPAFFADVLPGDVLQKIDGEWVFDKDSYLSAVQKAYGRKATYELLRRGNGLSIDLMLGPDGSWPSQP